mmetsp:Transcript_48597/g.146559  ORF Transcript_48597/g.146559 Transcript_48597/m.146559 type:complete len:542 (-) Transcript_48597:90-1715(-)
MEDRKKTSETGLSGLSSRLRELQATNKSQTSAIDKLERQLRILADTKGVSIGDVRASLLEACQGEAFNELQNEVGVLRAKLDAAHHSNAGAHADKGSSFEKEAANRTIADLQLKLGELEENEGVLRKELSGLYKGLKERTSKATQLEASCAKLRGELEKNKEQVDVTQQMSTKLVMKAEADAEKEKYAQQVEFDCLKGQLRDSEVQLKMEIDRSKLLEEELDARERELQLKSDQFNSRFTLQDERILDMEQQLSSLYTAFGMEEEDRAGEADRRAVLETYLTDADSELAQQIHKVDEVKSSSPVSSVQSANLSFRSESTPTQTLHGTELRGTPNPPQVLLSGWLMKKDKTSLVGGGWKKRYFALTRSDDGSCRMRYSDAPGQKVKGTFGNIIPGSSTVRQTTQYSKWPHAFELRINPRDAQSRVLCAAAPGQKCLSKWLAALRKITDIPDSDMEAALVASMQEQHRNPAVRDGGTDTDSAINANIRQQSARHPPVNSGNRTVKYSANSTPAPPVGRQQGRGQSEDQEAMRVAKDLYQSGLL